MKLLSAILAAVFALSVPSFAAKADKGTGKGGGGRKALRMFDRNRNQQIDGREVDAIKNAYGAFKKADSNSDGTLADDEIKALNEKAAKAKAKAPGAKAAKKKRNKAG